MFLTFLPLNHRWAVINSLKLMFFLAFIKSKKVQHARTLNETKNKLLGLSPRANYTDRATAVSQRSDCQLLRIKGTYFKHARKSIDRHSQR
jgi:hypothetical protein